PRAQGGGALRHLRRGQRQGDGRAAQGRRCPSALGAAAVSRRQPAPVAPPRGRPNFLGMVASDAHAEASAHPKAPLPARVKGWARGHPGGAIAIVAGVVVLIVALLLLRAYLASRVTTDDATVDGHIAEINSRVAGTVRAVFVEENQAVKKGQALLELDPRDYQVAAARAGAELAQAQANVAAEDPRTSITRVTQETQVATAAEDTAAARARVAGAEREL